MSVFIVISVALSFVDVGLNGKKGERWGVSGPGRQMWYGFDQFVDILTAGGSNQNVSTF